MRALNQHIHLRFWVLTTFVIGCLIAGGLSLKHNADQNRELIRDIQQQRTASIVHDCRHDDRQYVAASQLLNEQAKVPVYVPVLIQSVFPFHPDCKAYAKTKVPR